MLYIYKLYSYLLDDIDTCTSTSDWAISAIIVTEEDYHNYDGIPDHITFNHMLTFDLCFMYYYI